MIKHPHACGHSNNKDEDEKNKKKSDKAKKFVHKKWEACSMVFVVIARKKL